MSYNKDILPTLFYRGKIFLEDLEKDKDLITYLNFLVEKEVIRFNKENGFYYSNYDRKENVLKSPFVKLKYFYHWKFPPTHKDEEILPIKITPFLKDVFEKGKVDHANFIKHPAEYEQFCNAGFIVEDDHGEYFIDPKLVKEALFQELEESKECTKP